VNEEALAHWGLLRQKQKNKQTPDGDLWETGIQLLTLLISALEEDQWSIYANGRFFP
jgi:GH15 family glucan-1,4-alpha-glucosidase